MVLGILKKFDIIHECCTKTCGHESVSAERCDYGDTIDQGNPTTNCVLFLA